MKKTLLKPYLRVSFGLYQVVFSALTVLIPSIRYPDRAHQMP